MIMPSVGVIVVEVPMLAAQRPVICAMIAPVVEALFVRVFVLPAYFVMIIIMLAMSFTVIPNRTTISIVGKRCSRRGTSQYNDTKQCF